jgi:hypothetical protein
LRKDAAEPLQLEMLQLKRALVEMQCQTTTESELKAILEYRGRTLVLSRSKGNCDVRIIVEALASDFFDRYGDDGLVLVATREDQRICESTVKDPDEFLGYLHFIHTRGGLTIDKGRLKVRRILKILENV